MARASRLRHSLTRGQLHLQFAVDYGCRYWRRQAFPWSSAMVRLGCKRRTPRLRRRETVPLFRGGIRRLRDVAKLVSDGTRDVRDILHLPRFAADCDVDTGSGGVLGAHGERYALCANQLAHAFSFHQPLLRPLVCDAASGHRCVGLKKGLRKVGLSLSCRQ